MTRGWWQLVLAPALATLTLAGLAHVPCCAAQSSGQALATASQFLSQARDREELGDLAEASAKLTAAIELAPDWAPPRGLMGKIRQRQGRDEEARGQYQTHQYLALLHEGVEPRTELLVQTAEAEALLILSINRERLSRGLRALTPSADLSRVARGHSREMRDLNYFSHHSPRKSRATMVERFELVYGKTPRVLAENLSRHGGDHYCFTLENIAQSHDRLMNSPSHRRSILWEKVRQIGVGVTVNARGDYWITETFAGDCDAAK